jgi:2-polyprenyl-6-hydroxyphenyl methylase/3-demethylubiquinone-9 3-methyltransferase
LVERQMALRRALAGLPAASAVLDAGCGNGEFTSFLASLGYSVTGVDVSATAIARSKAQVPNGRFEVASLEAGLPFQGGEFSAVWCSEVLEHITDVHAALSEFNRVLVFGGVVVLTTSYHGLIKNLAIAVAGFERHYDPYLSHIRFFTRRSLGACLSRTGFTPISWSGVGRRWPLWMSHFVVARKDSHPGAPPQIMG